jgi:hypothetical protein
MSIAVSQIHGAPPLKATAKVVKGIAPWVAGGVVGGAVYEKIHAALKSEEGAYAFYMTLNKDASSLNWADYWSKADVYAVVTIDGVGSYLLPDIHYEYSGEQIRSNLRLPVIPKGRKVLVQVFDDDSSSDEIWNGILKMRGRVMFDADALIVGLKMDVDLRHVNILDKPVALDARDYICEFLFETPAEGWFNRQWTAEGMLKDSSGLNVGKIGFSQIDRK